MFRYIIIVWNDGDVLARNEVTDIRNRIRNSPLGWRSKLERPGMFVACVDHEFYSDAAITVGESDGVILGTIFRSSECGHSSQPTPIRRMCDSQSKEIFRSKGRSLITNYWGHYVAALRHSGNSSALVLRSPVSPLACFHVDKGTLSVFFSHVDDCIELQITSLSINWDAITAQVIGGDHLTNETSIREIDSLECGECVECGPSGRARHVYWDPRSFLQDKSPVCFDEAVQTIRRATDYCVRAHSSRHDRILIKLSGGLDSSIVLSALSRASHKPSITAVTYYSRGSGDERHFARSMAGIVNCRLVECPRNMQLDFSRFLDCNRTVRPVLQFSAPDVEARNIALARELNASGIFDGELGDNIFGSRPSPGVLVESFRQFGLGGRFLGAAVDYAMLTKRSLWETLMLGRSEAQSVSANPDFSAVREMERVYGTERARSATLASAEAMERYIGIADRFLHPWFRQSRRIAPGSHAILIGLITVTSTTYHSPFSDPRDPPQVHPLVSQPLVEIALRLPSHLHCRFATDRAAARAAFADVLPEEILQRGLGKGGPTLWAKDVVEANSGFLRDFLLGGILVRQRLIDPAKLEAVLSRRISKSSVVVGDIFAKLYIEAWLRQWQQV